MRKDTAYLFTMAILGSGFGYYIYTRYMKSRSLLAKSDKWLLLADKINRGEPLTSAEKAWMKANTQA
jgi:hypothetical protein